MKELWTKYKLYVYGVGAFIILMFLLFYFIDKRDKTYQIEADQLRAKFITYQQDYDAAVEKISKQQLTIDSLIKVKQIKDIKYVHDVKEFGNPYIISNDSITKYIASKIHNK